MNKSQALKEAQRRWGKDAVIRDDRRQQTTPAQRQAAREALFELRGYIVTNEDRRYFRTFKDELIFQSIRQRFSVGIHGGFFIGIRGTGDTWEECFENADKMWGKKTA